MNVAVPQAVFDESLAQVYFPHRVVKQAVLVPVPDQVTTTINAEWGEEQKFRGPWYAIYDPEGVVKYGSAKVEFEETHLRAEETENGYFKQTPIRAYRYEGPAARVVTILSGGVVETENTVHDGDWMVRWPHGEVGVMDDPKLRRLYNVY